MATVIKIPGVENDELTNQNNENNMHGLSLEEHDGIDKLFSMLVGALHAVFGDDVLLVKILKLLLQKISPKKKLSVYHEKKVDVNDDEKKQQQLELSINYVKCMIDHGLVDISFSY